MLYQVPFLICAIEREEHVEVGFIFILLVDHQGALQLDLERPSRTFVMGYEIGSCPIVRQPDTVKPVLSQHRRCLVEVVGLDLLGASPGPTS